MKKYTMIQYNDISGEDWHNVMGLCYRIERTWYRQKKWFYVGNNSSSYIDYDDGFMREATLSDLRVEFELIEG